MILHITPHCRSHSGSSIIWGLSWNSRHITAPSRTMGPVAGNIPAGLVPALWMLNTVQHSLFMRSLWGFFPLERPLFIRLPLMKEPWRHLSFFWILAILNNQYCYLFPLAPILVEGTAIYQLWSLLREKLNSTRLGQTSMAREKELFITVFFLRPVPCPLSI